MSSHLLSLLLIIGSLFFVSLHAEEINEIKLSKACKEPHFVLVHGYGGGAWCWYKVISRLEAAGYNATSLDLTGTGTDLTNTSTVHTFQEYNKPLIDFLSKLPDDQKVILVGHSAGGLSVTDASYKFSKKIQVAVYAAAVMLEHGFVTEQDREDGFPSKSKIRRGRYLQTRVKSSGLIIREIISEEDDVLKRILTRGVPDKAILSARFEGNEAEKVKRIYIKTLYDKTILPMHQDAMIQRWPPAEVIEVETEHDIINTNPQLLCELLENIANMIECN